MQPYSLYLQVIDILQDKLDVDVTETFDGVLRNLPLENNLLTVELVNGSENKTVICLKVFVTESAGAQKCRDLTELARSAINSANLDYKKTFTSCSVSFNKESDAFCQESNVLFETDNTSFPVFNIAFGGEQIPVGDSTKLLVKRRINVYYSPISDTIMRDLGTDLKTVSGATYLENQTFSKLYGYAVSGEVKTLTIGDVSFNAKLKMFSGRPGGKTAFEFLEVRGDA